MNRLPLKLANKSSLITGTINDINASTGTLEVITKKSNIGGTIVELVAGSFGMWFFVDVNGVIGSGLLHNSRQDVSSSYVLSTSAYTRITLTWSLVGGDYVFKYYANGIAVPTTHAPRVGGPFSSAGVRNGYLNFGGSSNENKEAIVLGVRFWDVEQDASTIAGREGSLLTSEQKGESSLKYYWYPDTESLPLTSANGEVIPAIVGPSATVSSTGTATWLNDTPVWLNPANTNPPSSAPVLSVVSTGHNSVSFSWGALNDATSYTLKRGGSIIKTGITSTVYTDTGLTPETQYSYTLTAVNNYGNSPESLQVNVTTSPIPPPDTTPPTPGAVTLDSATTSVIRLNVGAGSDNDYIASRILQVFSDAGRTNQIGSNVEASVGVNTISGLDESTPYYFRVIYADAANNTANADVSFSTTATIPVSPYVIHLGRGGGSGRTGLVMTWGEIKAAGALTFLFRTKAPDWYGTNPAKVFRIEDSSGKVWFTYDYQNSPYNRVSLSNKSGTSSFDGPQIEGYMNPDGGGTFEVGTMGHRDYIDYAVTVRLNTPTEYGVTKGYREGALTLTGKGGAAEDFIYYTKKEKDWGWADNEQFRFVLGDESYILQNFFAMDVAVWKGEKDAAFIASINKRPLSSLSATDRANDDLLVWYRATGEEWTPSESKIPNNADGASSLPSASMTFTGNASLDANELPHYSGFGTPADTTGPTVSTPSTVTSLTNTGATINVNDLGTDACGRVITTIYITKRNPNYTRGYIQKIPVTSTGATVVTGLQSGIEYAAVVEHRDLYSNVTVQTIPFQTTGTAEPIRYRSFAVRGTNTSARTQPLLMPMHEDGMTLSFWIYRWAGDAGNGTISDITDNLSASNPASSYTFMSTSLSSGKISLGINTGTNPKSSSNGSLSSTGTVGFGVWEHWIVGVQYPDVASEGWLRLYRNGVLDSQYKFSDIMTDWLTDWNPAKMPVRVIPPYGRNSMSRYDVAGITYWSAKPDIVAAEISNLAPWGYPNTITPYKAVSYGQVYDSEGEARPFDGYMLGSQQGWDATGIPTFEEYTGKTLTTSSLHMSADVPNWIGDPNPAPPVLNVKVRPMARSVAFTFPLDWLGGYDEKSYGEWIQPGTAALYWSNDGLALDSPGKVWKRGQDFQRVQADRLVAADVVTSRPPDPRMAAMLFGLVEGETYDWKVSVSGGDYPAVADAVGTITTLTSTPPIGTGKVQVVIDPVTSTETSINAAVKAGYESGASHVELISSLGPGVRTVVRAAPHSIYHGKPYGYSGTPEAWKLFSVAPDHDIVFDGSMEEYDVIGAAKWEKVIDPALGITSDDNIYRMTGSLVPYYETIWYERPTENVGITILNVTGAEQKDDGSLLAPQSWAEWSDPSMPSSGIQPKGGGLDSTIVTRSKKNQAAYAWVWTETTNGKALGKYYVHLIDGVDPNTVRMKIPSKLSALNLSSCSYVVIDGFHIAYQAGIGIIDVSNIVIRNNVIHNTSKQFFTGAYTSASSLRDRIVISDNTFIQRGMGADSIDPSLPVPGWEYLKASIQEQIGIPLKGTSISTIDNHIEGAFNGYSGYAGANWTTTSNNTRFNQYPEATEIDNNLFTGIGDDAIEPEQWALTQVYSRNTFEKSYKGVSLAPLTGGPVYVIRNKFLGLGEYVAGDSIQSFMKFGNDDPGDTAYKMVSHNSIVDSNADTDGKPLPGIMSSGTTGNIRVFNNYVSYDNIGVDFGFGAVGYPHEFDGNRYVSRRPNDPRLNYGLGFAVSKTAGRWGEGTQPSANRITAEGADGFAQWQRGRTRMVDVANYWPGYVGETDSPPTTPVTGNITSVFKYHWLHDPHGSYSEGLHEFVSPTAGNFTPVSIFGWNAGIPLRGINDSSVGPGWAMYEEEVPTVGAVPLVVGTPVVTVSSGRARVGVSLVVTLTATDADGTITDLSAVVTGPGGSVPHTGSPVAGIGTNSASATITFLPTLPGAYTVTAVATDNQANEGQAQAVSRARRGTTSVIVVQ